MDHASKRFAGGSSLLARAVPVVLAWTALCLHSSAEASEAGLDILGLRLGMGRAAIVDLFKQAALSLAEENSDTLTCPRPLTPVDGAKQVQLFFVQDRLSKIILLFEIPPPEPTAATLMLRYEKEKVRLTQLFGPPTDDVAKINAPTEEERYEWLLRGRAYLQSSWKKAGTQLNITLWLYGADEGIVLMEMYSIR